MNLKSYLRYDRARRGKDILPEIPISWMLIEVLFLVICLILCLLRQ